MPRQTPPSVPWLASRYPRRQDPPGALLTWLILIVLFTVFAGLLFGWFLETQRNWVGLRPDGPATGQGEEF